MVRREFLDRLRDAQYSMESLGRTNGPKWFTPEVVEDFAPEDFQGLPPDRLEQLERAVRAFRELAAERDPDTERELEAVRELGIVIRETRRVVLADWVDALRRLTDEVAAWCRELGWETRE